MRIREEALGEEPNSNLTPLIDVVFILLIFFMLTTTFLDPEEQLDLQLPAAESGSTEQSPPESIVIQLLADGRIVLQGEELQQAQLRSRLTDMASRDSDIQVTIRGDRRVDHGAVVGVLDACGLAGLSNLSVGTLNSAAGGSDSESSSSGAGASSNG